MSWYRNNLDRVNEWISVIYLYFILLISGILFSRGNSDTNFLEYVKETNINNLSYGIFIFLGAVSVPFVLLTPTRSYHTRRIFYVLCGLPLTSFTTPYGLWYIINGKNYIGSWMLVSMVISIFVIATITFRDIK